MNKRSRKTKGLAHRLFALLLCCACLAAVVPAYAIASEAGTTPTEAGTVVVDPTEGTTAGSETQPTTAPTVAEEVTEPSEENVVEVPSESEADKLYARLMACGTLDELNAALDALTEEEEALLDQFTEEQNAALEAKTQELGGYNAAMLKEREFTIPQGGSQTVSAYVKRLVGYPSCVPKADITVTLDNGTDYVITVGKAVTVGDYKLTVRCDTWNGGFFVDEVTIHVTEAAPTGTVPVHVYVASSDSGGNSWRYNEEFQDLIGLYVCDSNGYFPAGTIYLDASYLNGKANANTSGSGLINSAGDWATLLTLLSGMDNNNLGGSLGASWASNNKTLDFSNNNGNHVSEYLSQAEEIYNQTWGSKHTALFRWHLTYDPNDAGQAHLGHPGDATTKYHLDLCFNTNKITFICGNNGITSAISQDAYDGKEVDSRAYITGSLIQNPRNLKIPAGYQLVGYYTDPNFNTPWNGIGTPLNEDQTVYIKITKLENVILYYKVAEGQGKVNPDSEGLNPETGVAAGSTAKPENGWVFEGWYAEKECTTKLSSDVHYVPTKPETGKWVSTTYWAKFVQSDVELAIKKIVVGNMGDQNKEFTFTVSGSSVAEANRSFKLKHGGEEKVKAKAGDKITITETPEGYEASYQIAGNDNVVKGESVTYEVTAAAEQTITFTNRKDATIDTGIALDSLPYILILAAVVAGGVVLMRRRRYHGED